MRLIHRRTSVIVGGLVAATALVVPIAAQADGAATGAAQPEAASARTVTIVEIIQNPTPPQTEQRHLAASHNPAFIAVTATRKIGSPGAGARWIKSDFGQFSTYENVKRRGECLSTSGNLNGANLRVEPCSSSDSAQRWTQGFDSNAFRKLQNLESFRVATRESGSVRLRVDQGLPTQKWRVLQL
jgi:hypothetical protein